MHPRDKGHREAIRLRLGARRVGVGLRRELGDEWYRLAVRRRGEVGRPCSCWMCRGPRYVRGGRWCRWVDYMAWT